MGHVEKKVLIFFSIMIDPRQQGIELPGHPGHLRREAIRNGNGLSDFSSLARQKIGTKGLYRERRKVDNEPDRYGRKQNHRHPRRHKSTFGFDQNITQFLGAVRPHKDLGMITGNKTLVSFHAFNHRIGQNTHRPSSLSIREGHVVKNALTQLPVLSFQVTLTQGS